MSTALCAVIFYLCFMDPQDFPEAPMTDFDKLVHWGMFLTVSLVVFFESTNYFKNSIFKKELLLQSFFFPIAYSGFIELMQEYLSPTRSGDWMDFLFDAIGALCGLVIVLIVNKKLVTKG